MDVQRFLYLISGGKPYLDPAIRAFPGSPARTAMLPSLIEMLASSIIREEGMRILEIGSMAGSSAMAMGYAVGRYSKHKGKVFCIDVWDTMDKVGFNTKTVNIPNTYCLNMYEVFSYNIRISELSDIIVPFVGRSEHILPALKDNYFDLIYIDGQHTYDAVMLDISHAKRLIAPGGVICGDDLELQFEECPQDELEQFAHLDDCRSPKLGIVYHPGVTLAVHQTFGRAKTFLGMFAFRKESEQDFSPVDLSALPRRIPAFFPERERAITEQQFRSVA